MNEFLWELSILGLTVNLLLYWGATRLANRFKSPLLNPLLITAAVIIVLLHLFDIPFEVYDKSASVFTLLLGPATVSLAIPLYKQLRVLKENLAAILLSVLAGCVATLLCVFGLSLLFHIPADIFASLLPKSTTTAIGSMIAGEIGGYPSLAAAAIGITGITGAMLARASGKWLKIKDPVAQGLALGTASHVIGTSAIAELGEIQAAMGSLAICVAGFITVILAPIVAGLYP
jgi:predicted murein hydrolase (TIGR00659 family)